MYYANARILKSLFPFYTLFVEQRKDIDRTSGLYSIKAPFEVMHADTADIRFFSKLAVDPKNCLLAVNLFTSKTHIYPMKSRHLLAQKCAKISINQNDSRLQKVKRWDCRSIWNFNKIKLKDWTKNT